MIALAFRALSWLLGAIFKKPAGQTQEAVQAANAAQERIVAQVTAGAAQAEARMAQAVTDAPQTKADVIDTLNKGEF